MRATLEIHQDYPGLYGAGQFNGTSGYEEAAAQGLVAGNQCGAQRSRARKPLRAGHALHPISARLIDDLVTKGCSDPYRMMTSRSRVQAAVAAG